MNRALLLAGAGVFVAASAFAQTPPPPSAPAPSTAAPVSPTAPAAPATPAPAAPTAASQQAAPSTADFVKNAAISGMFEIQSSKLALSKHLRADRVFADRMIRDHERLAADLKHTVRADHIKADIPTKLDDEHQKMLDQLRGENGKKFEADYATMQQQGHQQAVSLFQAYSQSGDNPALKTLAGKALPTLKGHLDMANKLS
jgi:putative membrane protein